MAEFAEYMNWPQTTRYILQMHADEAYVINILMMASKSSGMAQSFFLLTYVCMF